MFIKKMVLKGVGAGVGLAAEGVADRKEKKQQRLSRSPSPNPLMKGDSKGSDSDSEDDDEQEWQLDEAAAELAPPQYEEIDSDKTIDPEMVAQDFLTQYHVHPSTQSKEYKALPAPVILPQRRPKAKQRGFVRAYAPVLGECSGIDQQMFMAFLNDFDKASKASPVYDVINLACFAVGFVPNPIAMAVSTAVQVVNRTAQEIHSRVTRNAFLNKMNENLFMPRGLYCMIMTFKPNDAPVIGMNITSTDQALMKTVSEPESDFRKNLKKMRLTSGQTKGDMSLPEAAPLIYPAIDQYAEAQAKEGKDPSTLQTSGAFLGTYLDRRAQATYASGNSSSKLAVPETERSFKSKYADPNHPIHTGTIMGLLSGGRFDPVADKRVRKAERRAYRRGMAPLTEDEKKEAYFGRRIDRTAKKPHGPIGYTLRTVRRAMQQNVLYLTIVNLPSESEMKEMRQQMEMEMEKVKSH